MSTFGVSAAFKCGNILPAHEKPARYLVTTSTATGLCSLPACVLLSPAEIYSQHAKNPIITTSSATGGCSLSACALRPAGGGAAYYYYYYYYYY